LVVSGAGVTWLPLRDRLRDQSVGSMKRYSEVNELLTHFKASDGLNMSISRCLSSPFLPTAPSRAMWNAPEFRLTLLCRRRYGVFLAACVKLDILDLWPIHIRSDDDAWTKPRYRVT